MRSFITIVFATMPLLLANGGHTAVVGFDTQITRTLTDANNYGGCMVELVVSPETKGLDCKPAWVTASCTGDFAPKDVAVRNFEQAQLAMLTKNFARVRIRDDLKHNGFCFMERVYLRTP